MSHVELMFKQMDVDGDGVISMDDLEVALANANMGLDPELLMSRLDKENKGHITFADFEQGHTLLLGTASDDEASGDNGSLDSFQ